MQQTDFEKGGKETTERIEISNQESIRTLREKENYLTILKADTIKQKEMKEKVRKEHLRKTKKILGTKLCGRNLSKGINACVASLCKILWNF